MLLLLGAFTFWVMDHGAQEANWQNRLEPKKELKPLVTAPTKPRGGGMIELEPNSTTTPSKVATTQANPPASTSSPPPPHPQPAPANATQQGEAGSNSTVSHESSDSTGGK